VHHVSFRSVYLFFNTHTHTESYDKCVIGITFNAFPNDATQVLFQLAIIPLSLNCFYFI